MDLTNLNKEQREAVVTTQGPLLILAGAGSGKTKTLTTRIAYLLQEENVSSHEILAITFTNKAAGEMKERIIDLVGFLGERIWAGTFHSMCLRILRMEIEEVGYKPNFVIYDESDQQTLLKQILKEQNLDEKKFPPRLLANTISNFKNELLDPQSARKYINGDFIMEKNVEIYDIYQERLKQNNAVDFDDIIMLTVQLFERNAEILAKYQSRFRYIFVDEYQDTNHAQYRLIKLLAAKYRNICVVGDDDQSIYRWRGADIQNILNFEKDYPEAKVVKLEQNYRSTQVILDAAYSVIKSNSERKDKRLWTEKKGGAKIDYFTALDEEEEAFFVSREIKKRVVNGERTYADFAVLCRTTAQFRVLEENFIKNGIKYQIFGGMKFYSRKEIKDTLAYLKAIANPDDRISLARAVGAPKRGIGEASWQKISQYADENDISITLALLDALDAGITGKAGKAMVAFAEQMVEFQTLSEALPLRDLVETVLEQSGYLAMLADDKDVESVTKKENLEEFFSILESFDREHEPSAENLSQFLSEVALYTDLDNLAEKENTVTIMTMHGAKGLEFPIVFIVGMEENIFPHVRSISSMAESEMEEERRLCYVAITRAKEQVIMSRALAHMLYGRTSRNHQSRFIGEIPAELINDLSKRRSPQSSSNYGRVQTPIKPKSGNEIEKFNIGDKVAHTKWGVGVVISVKGAGDDLEYNVAFPSIGIKTLIAKYAPIKRA